MVETSRRREIEDVASSLFRERGYAATSVRDIARALDIQGASLYAHVASKEEVLWSIVDRTAARFESAAAAIEADHGPDPSRDPADPAALLAALVRAHVRVVTDGIGPATVFVHEWRSLGPARRAEVVERRDRYEARFRAAIAAGVRTAAFAPVDPRVGAAFILTALNGLVGWYRPDGRLSPDEIADAYSDLALRSVLDREVRT